MLREDAGLRVTGPEEPEVHKQVACSDAGEADGFSRSSANPHSQERRVPAKEISWLQGRPQSWGLLPLQEFHTPQNHFALP